MKVLIFKQGRVTIQPIRERTKKGLLMIAEDKGPGIEDVNLAMQVGFSTSNSLGLGLPGVRRLMDSFDIQSKKNKGTKVIVKKWVL